MRRSHLGAAVAVRIAYNIEIAADGCWLWQLSMTSGGYGQLKVGGRMRVVHRLAYEEFVGPIPDGLVLDHLCRVRHCVNPTHLEPVTVRENNIRSPFNTFGEKCRNGHDRTEANTKVNPVNGNRQCRVCRREASRAAYVGQRVPYPTLHGFDRGGNTGRSWRKQARAT